MALGRKDKKNIALYVLELESAFKDASFIDFLNEVQARMGGVELSVPFSRIHIDPKDKDFTEIFEKAIWNRININKEYCIEASIPYQLTSEKDYVRYNYLRTILNSHREPLSMNKSIEIPLRKFILET